MAFPFFLRRILFERADSLESGALYLTAPENVDGLSRHTWQITVRIRHTYGFGRFRSEDLHGILIHAASLKILRTEKSPVTYGLLATTALSTAVRSLNVLDVAIERHFLHAVYQISRMTALRHLTLTLLQGDQFNEIEHIVPPLAWVWTSSSLRVLKLRMVASNWASIEALLHVLERATFSALEEVHLSMADNNQFPFEDVHLLGEFLSRHATVHTTVIHCQMHPGFSARFSSDILPGIQSRHFEANMTLLRHAFGTHMPTELRRLVVRMTKRDMDDVHALLSRVLSFRGEARRVTSVQDLDISIVTKGALEELSWTRPSTSQALNRFVERISHLVHALGEVGVKLLDEDGACLSL
jgi:hypothetical protein